MVKEQVLFGPSCRVNAGPLKKRKWLFFLSLSFFWHVVKILHHSKQTYSESLKHELPNKLEQSPYLKWPPVTMYADKRA